MSTLNTLIKIQVRVIATQTFIIVANWLSNIQSCHSLKNSMNSQLKETSGNESTELNLLLYYSAIYLQSLTWRIKAMNLTSVLKFN
jgi:hypothetical protein